MKGQKMEVERGGSCRRRMDQKKQKRTNEDVGEKVVGGFSLYWLSNSSSHSVGQLATRMEIGEWDKIQRKADFS
jgi:hypothetical protein